jgi:hypothetical protein
MTALALQSLSFSTKLLNGLFSAIKKTLQGMMVGYILARQSSVNRIVAQQLIDAGEYRQDQYYDVLHKMNQQCIASIHKEFGNA